MSNEDKNYIHYGPQKNIIKYETLNNKATKAMINNKIRWGREETVNDKVVKVPALNYKMPNKEEWHQRFSYRDDVQKHNGLFAVKYYLKDNPDNYIVLSRKSEYPYPQRIYGCNTFLNDEFVHKEEFFSKFKDGKYLMEIVKRDGGIYKNIQRQMKKENIDKKEEDLYDKTIKEDVNYFPY